MASSSPSERLGDYELLHELKSGGMGSVFLARKRSTGGFEKLLAIKTIRAELSSQSELRTMFLDEARLLARLEHPAVAQVYDFGEQDETLFLAMEYVAGVRFSDLAEAGTPPAIALRLIASVCGALHTVHELRDLDGEALGIVHRDVSPDNLMLSFDGHVKVLDFGIALMRGRQAPVTEYGTIKGKPPYLSPEQVKGKRVDRRADIWSVGVVLWELLTGRHLFVGDSLFAIALAVDEQEIAPPSEFAGQLPEGLDAIVLKALTRDVDQRYQDAGAMAEDLLAIASSIAAPSTAAFAGAALAPECEEHRLWLRDVLGGRAEPQSTGRPTGMLTIPAEALLALEQGESDLEVEASSGDASGDTEVAPTFADVMERAEIASSPGFLSGKGLLGAVMVLLLALLGAGVWWGFSADQSSQQSALATLDAGRADAPALALTENLIVVDAGAALVDIADARVTPDARERKSGTGRTQPKQNKDAAPKDEERSPIVKKPPAAVGFGTLTIAAQPFALVRVDGKEIGSTPLLKEKFPAGSHVVELIHPDTGKVRLRKKVDLPVDGHKSVIAR